MAEITLTFDSGRVMYGFCSLKEPNATLPRYILINWVSRGGCCPQLSLGDLAPSAGAGGNLLQTTLGGG